MRETIIQIANEHASLPSLLDYGPATASEILEIERQLGPLPSDYRRYLLEFRGGYLLGKEMYGVRRPSDDEEFPPVEINSIVEMNRSIADQGLVASGAVMFSSDFGDNWYYFGATQENSDEHRPVYSHGLAGHFVPFASSFVEFIKIIASDDVENTR